MNIIHSCYIEGQLIVCMNLFTFLDALMIEEPCAFPGQVLFMALISCSLPCKDISLFWQRCNRSDGIVWEASVDPSHRVAELSFLFAFDLWKGSFRRSAERTRSLHFSSL